jgi:cation diffusion facilitator family transporter
VRWNVDSSTKARARCARCGNLIIYVSIVEAIVFMVLKVVLGLSCGSRALVAASLYSVQDFASSLVAAIGMKISARPADHDHPYGHGKVEYLVVALTSLLVLLGIIALLITSLAGLFGQEKGAKPPTMLAFWVASVCGMACWLIAGRQECAGEHLNSPALKSCAAHMHSDCVASVAVLASVIAVRVGYPALDHIVAITEAVHVVFVSGQMLGSAVSGLMDTSADPILVDKLKSVVGEVQSVERVRRTVARWAGQTLLAQIDVEVGPRMRATEVDELRELIRQAVRTRVCGRSETLVRVSPVSVV